MKILSGSHFISSEYDVDILITTDVKGYNFSVPYTFYFDGNKVYIYQYGILKYTIDKKIDVKFEDFILRVLIGNEIGIIENYDKAKPDLFVCFEKTNYPSKFFYRKAQMWVGAQVSNVNVFGHIIYNGVVNRMLFSSKSQDGRLFEGTTYVLLNNEELVFGNQE
ncbi:MAG: hypothetical protein WHS64_09400 [Fervidobacterium sp.]|uniref:Uncharacterized protein n=1 Tax=Fervidobacterium gondwanense DSM 13020 TaxID=1121883 RepID=A0A1M7SM65_FERGO|nr:hypothetical protein [Fervidobacterium gondwanense]UXF01477.1 hypothetical protein IB67_08010 [Fervidobacterium riparium]SHN59534.1 hypothetical protein SAMN02745226_01076 [Fervidobacterium gondwanense DSM 13020]